MLAVADTDVLAVADTTVADTTVADIALADIALGEISVGKTGSRVLVAQLVSALASSANSASAFRKVVSPGGCIGRHFSLRQGLGAHANSSLLILLFCLAATRVHFEMRIVAQVGLFGQR